MSWTPSSASSVGPGMFVRDEGEPSAPSLVAYGGSMEYEYGGGGYYPHQQVQLQASAGGSSAGAQIALTLGSSMGASGGVGGSSTGLGGIMKEEDLLRLRTSSNCSPLPQLRIGGVPSPAAVLLEQDNNSCPPGGMDDGGEHEDLLVFGYECKIFRDDERARWVEEQKHLIPWMGNPDLLIDRYDCRGALMDVSRYESGSSSASLRQGQGGGGGSEVPEQDNNLEAWNEMEEVEEKELEEERYRDLNEDEDYDEGAYDRATDFKRLQSAMDGMISESQKIQSSDSRQYATFQYDYNEQNHEVCMGPEPKRLHDDDAPYERPVGLYIPEEIALPTTMKVHAIIEKTAKFIASQGNQMEIILKTKQSANPLFDFLTHGGSLNPYYKFLVHAIRNGIYRPVEPMESDSKQAGTLGSLSEYGGGDDDSEHTYLHPSLFRSTSTTTSYPSVSYPTGAASSSRHSSYSMLVSKIKGTESPDPVSQQSVVSAPTSANSEQVNLVYASYGNKTSHEPVPPVRPQKQLPSTQDQLIIEKMASYVIKNGTNFEVLAQNKGDPRFAFLNSTHQYHWYYLNCKERFKAECNAVVASSDFVTYSSSSSSTVSSVSNPVKSNSTGIKKSALVAEIAELRRKGAGLLQGMKLASKEKVGIAGGGTGTAPPATASTEDVFSQANLVSSKDKDKPVIRFATSLSLNTGSSASGSGTTGSNRTEVIITLAMPSDAQTDENKEKDKPAKAVDKRRSPSIEDELPKIDEFKFIVTSETEEDKEEGELLDEEESTSDIFPFDEDSGPTGGNASPVSENEDEKKRRRTERKRKAALFLQKLKLSKGEPEAIGSSSLPATEQTTQTATISTSRIGPTGPSLGDLLNRRLQEGDISSKPKTAGESYGDGGGADIYVEEISDGRKSPLSSRHSPRSRSRSYMGTSSSSRSRKKRRRSRSYSSTPSYSSSPSGSSDGSSDYRDSYSRKRSSKRKHKKKKKKHEKSSRSSHQSSRR